MYPHSIYKSWIEGAEKGERCEKRRGRCEGEGLSHPPLRIALQHIWKSFLTIRVGATVPISAGLSVHRTITRAHVPSPEYSSQLINLISRAENPAPHGPRLPLPHPISRRLPTSSPAGISLNARTIRPPRNDASSGSLSRRMTAPVRTKPLDAPRFVPIALRDRDRDLPPTILPLSLLSMPPPASMRTGISTIVCRLIPTRWPSFRQIFAFHSFQYAYFHVPYLQRLDTDTLG